MDHLVVSRFSAQDAAQSKWRLEFGMPSAEAVGAPDPQMEKGARMGVSLKLDF
jgi:hypothetical protein